jgi:hypothetical protein
MFSNPNSMPNSILLIRPKPFADESIIGYFLRLAESNGYESINWLLQLFRLSPSDGNQSYAYAYGLSSLSRAADMVQLEESILNKLAYQPLENSPSSTRGNYKAFGQNLFFLLIPLRNPKLCPKCLFENAYCRKIWELGMITACPRHKCLLAEECPACRQKIKWNRPKLCKCPCGFDFRNIKTHFIPKKELRMVEHIYYLCQFWQDEVKNFPSLFYDFTLEELTSLLFLIISQKRGRTDKTGKSLIKRHSILELHQELNEALAVYEDFPNNFYKFLDSLKKVHLAKVQKSPRSYHLSTTRHFVFGAVIRAFFTTHVNQKFDFLREAFKEYYIREKLNFFNLNLDYELQSATEFLTSHLTMNEAKKMLKIGVAPIKLLIEAGNLTAVKGKAINKKQIWFIEKKSALKAQELLTDCISIPQIQVELGVQKHHVDLLLQYKLLNEVKGLYVSRTITRVFSLRETNEIKQIFENAYLQRQKTNSGKLLTAAEAGYFLGRLGIDFGIFVLMVKKSKLAPAGKGKKKGLLGYLYDETEIRKICDERLKDITAETISLQEAEKELKTGSLLIKRLIEKGWLEQIEIEDARFLQTRIVKKSMEEFKQKYILAKELALQYRTLPHCINQMLAELKIFPVDNSHKTHFVYWREDVIKVNLDQYRRSKPTVPLFSIKETAKILNLNENEISLLVAHGAIRPFKRSEDLGYQELFFSKVGIKRFRQLQIACQKSQIDIKDIFSLKFTLKLLGINIMAFEHRYIKTKKIKPLKFNNRSKLFFHRLEVERLRQIELNGIRSGEAAKILQVKVAHVNRLVLAGELNIISGPRIDGFNYNVYLREDVEALQEKRTAFKKKQLNVGKSTRFGKVSGNRYSKIQRAKVS